MDLCLEALGAEHNLWREPSRMEGILTRRSEMLPSSSFELTWLNKLADVMQDSHSMFSDCHTVAHSLSSLLPGHWKNLSGF